MTAMNRSTLLAGDIGGTTTRLRLVEWHDGSWSDIAERHFRSADHASLADIINAFFSGPSGVRSDAACLAVAGPVRHVESGDHVRVTNLPWEIESRALSTATGIDRITIINDFEAVGYSIECLAEMDLVAIQAGESDGVGPRAILGAGTGLGQSIVVPQGSSWAVIPTEGGHVSFGPADSLQLELAGWLLTENGRATYEDILSGAGLVRLHEFLKRQHGELAATSIAGSTPVDPAAAITEAAMTRRDPVALEAVRLFASIYGSQAGNLALATGATGGIYIAGGIAQRILPVLQEGGFLNSFRNKPPMNSFMERIPVSVVAIADAGLRGAIVRGGRIFDSSMKAE